jgi:hypothetical protein
MMKRLQQLKPLLFGLSLCSLAWAIVLEARSASEMSGFTISGGVNYDRVVFSVLLVLASAALLSSRPRNLALAAALSSMVLADVLFRDFWLLARAAEVPVLSGRHLSLWWPNLREGQLPQILLSGAILFLSAVALIRGARSLQ